MEAMHTAELLTPFAVVRKARKEQGLTQSQLAARVQCAQSAISMFEGGRVDALSRDKVGLIAEVLELDVESLGLRQPQAQTATGRVLKYCPNDDCPSNIPFCVRGQVCFMPSMEPRAEATPSHCRLCGDLLEDRCPGGDCGAVLTEGAFCPQCGTAYVAMSRALDGADPNQWADEQRARIKDVVHLTRAMNPQGRLPGAGRLR